ncbi:hypothetical protein [Leeuwenhoekiella sp. MAR_2009_132]|uniref:hypothetical protein n=1 Tax=Leeuwenhoekiella sp. MAR_2009_132 TaxID=1392489 RepID=UPI0004910D66|nr:hypothetical protein [Leeuwenhoekiella sp. MAR_2009_132]
METKELVKSKETQQKIQLVKGTFSTSEASNVVLSLIDQKINFHKIQRMQLWEKNHNRDSNQIDTRIQELIEEKRIATAFINNASRLGQNLKIDGILTLSIVE